MPLWSLGRTHRRCVTSFAAMTGMTQEERLEADHRAAIGRGPF
jgi:hypothetical protein